MVSAMSAIYGSFVWLFTRAYPAFDDRVVPSYPTVLLIVALVTLIVLLVRRIFTEEALASLAALASRDPVAVPHSTAVLDLLAEATAAAAQSDTGSDASRERPDDPSPPARPQDTAALAPMPPQTPPLMRRLPDAARGPIHRLEARNHFVHVVTAAGSHDLRLRFADAVCEMDGVPGVCTHRSHWVRVDSVVAVDRDGTRLRLQIADGTWIPVSRGYRDRVEAAGLLSPALLAAASAAQQPVDR